LPLFLILVRIVLPYRSRFWEHVDHIVQGIATSIDALSVGLTIANYNIFNALLCSFIIFLLTFIICYIGIILGKKFGTKYSKFAFILGGVILIAIGLEIFITGIC
jgi:putative Mn2+ efflux pump MntP